ncbi:MAG: 30S ribosomal protein S18 [Puniceicoccaceae bacterium]
MSENEDSQNTVKNPTDLTFQDTDELSRFVTDTGKILPRKYTGLTSRQQRHVSRVIKQSRSMLLMK